MFGISDSFDGLGSLCLMFGLVVHLRRWSSQFSL